ncbi:MAG: GlcNAc-transferase family protein [Silvibacterium sp.]
MESRKERIPNQRIFVSIASYRDLQLVPTIADCLRKASHPERLTFGICWQRGPEEQLPFLDDPRFRVLEVKWQDSKGACWARAEIMKLWQGEDWFLQVDSHCRFAYRWDDMLLRAILETGSDKPILSTYAASFIPGENELLQGAPLQIAFQAFTQDGIPQLKPAEFRTPRKLERPVRARFLSAGFLFAPGPFVEQVPYDPDLYFLGEEIAMTVRAFTQGYDLFHPIENVVWHDYLRAGARKHWGDHTEANRVARPSGELDEKSRSKVQRLLLGIPVDTFGLGKVRTLADYEAYAGLSFTHRKAQLYTVRMKEPPNPEAPSNWMATIHPWIVKVMVPRSRLHEDALEDPAFWYLGIQDDRGYEICRLDVMPDTLAPLRGSDEQIALICEFPSEATPSAWTMQPMSRSKGWLPMIGSPLKEDDFAILAEDDENE